MTTPFWRQLQPTLEYLLLTELAEKLQPSTPRRTSERYVSEDGVDMTACYENGVFVKAYASVLVNQPGGWFTWGPEGSPREGMIMTTQLEHSFLLGLSEKLAPNGGVRTFRQVDFDDPTFFHETTPDAASERLYTAGEISHLAADVIVKAIYVDTGY